MEGVSLRPTSEETTAESDSSGLDVSIQPGNNDYPGVAVVPNSPAWNLSKFGHIEATILNTGTKALHVALRVDNPGPWQDSP